MNRPRVVSLAPSATATLRAIGADEQLVGVTDHCEADAPAVGGWLTADPEAVLDLDPDLVLTTDALQDRLRDSLVDRGLDVHHLDPRSLPEVLESFEELGGAVGRPEAGRDLRARAAARIEAVERAVARALERGSGERARPTVYCEEWGEPPMAAGNWVPEVVAAAGGVHPFVEPGERSRRVERDEVEAAGPDHVVVHHCGKGAGVDPAVLAERSWDLPALEAGNVHVIDDALLNQPSPRLLDGLEALARRFHPEAMAEVEPADDHEQTTDPGPAVDLEQPSE